MPVRTIEDIKGLRLHVQTRFAGEAVHALGARAVRMPSAQLALAITEHVVDGCVDPWDMAPALKLGDLLKAHTDFADLSSAPRPSCWSMNKSRYDRLPRDLKTVINDNSGQLAAGMAGAMWDLQAAAVADMVSQRGDPIITLMPDAVTHWRKATEPVIEAWRKRMKEHKIDGGKLLASARSLLTKYANEPEPQPPQPPQPPEASMEGKPLATVEAPPAAASTPVATPAAAAASPGPIVKPAPAAASPPKTLDIPL